MIEISTGSTKIEVIFTPRFHCGFFLSKARMTMQQRALASLGLTKQVTNFKRIDWISGKFSGLVGSHTTGELRQQPGSMLDKNVY